MLHVGLCLPQICTNEDVHLLVDTMLNSKEFGKKYFMDQTFSIVESKTIKLRDDFFQMTMSNIFLWGINLIWIKRLRLKPFLLSTLFWCFRCMLAMNFIFVIGGSIYTSIASSMCNSNEKLSESKHKIISNGNNNSLKGSSNNAVLNVEHTSTTFTPQINQMKLKPNSLLDRFMSCFCMFKNSSIITTEYLGTDSIEVIHGMR